MTEKRFINDIDIGQLIDTKGELSTIDYSDKVDFYELWEFLNKLNDENEQLKSDNKWLFKCVENQSALINELDSTIMAYNMEHKITIKLTEKDLKTLDKALSYYTHQKVEE